MGDNTISMPEWFVIILVVYTISIPFSLLIGVLNDFIPLDIWVLTFDIWVPSLIMIGMITVILALRFKIDDME